MDKARQPTTREDLVLVEIDGDGLVYDREVDAIHSLNPLASLVFRLCDGTATVDETAAGIAGAFGVPVEHVKEDVKRTVSGFGAAGLLHDVERTAPYYGTTGPLESRSTDERGRIRIHVEPGR